MNERILGILFLLLLFATPAAAQTAIGPADAVERALRNNPSLAAAVLESRSARWAVVSEETFFSPRLQLDAALRHDEATSLGEGGNFLAQTDLLFLQGGVVQRLRPGTELALRLEHNTTWNANRVGVGFFGFSPLYETSARFELTQPLLRGAFSAVNTAALRVAESQETESERAAIRNASLLVRDVLTQWWELWYAEESLRIERQSLELAEQQLEESRRRVDLGTVAPVSVLAFETRVAERMESVAGAERTRQQQAVGLGALLGEASPAFGTMDSVLAPAHLPAGDARAAALEASPELREAEASLQTAEIRAGVAADPARPRLDIGAFAEVGKLAPSFVGLGEGDAQNAWSAGVNMIFELPLDRREYRAASERARLDLAAARRRLEQSRLSVEAAVEQQLAQIDSARARVELAGRTADVAARQLAAERARYATGGATSLAVLEAEEDMRTARLRLARAEVDLRSAAAAVEHQTGALLVRWLPAGLDTGAAGRS